MVAGGEVELKEGGWSSILQEKKKQQQQQQLAAVATHGLQIQAAVGKIEK